MSDPLRTDTARALDAAVDGDRDAKIEQLLLLGLDHYFLGRYEQAINVWTRALFLDRAHPRARAYIDRARSALAERQRESEELLQQGVAAFHRGEALQARRLLLSAIDGGAPAEEAIALLDRLDRLEPAAPPPSARAVARQPRQMDALPDADPTRRRAVTIAAIIVLVAGGVAAGALMRGLPLGALWREGGTAVRPSPSFHDPLPAPPRRTELVVARARSLAASGYLHDALDLLDAVPAADPERQEADRLRADIQRQLLALAPMPPPVSREKGASLP